MRLFHVSEEENIEIFIPRTPTREDLDQNIGLVWAVNEKCLPNFLTPRDCPRVCYHINENTKQEDIDKYIDSPTINHVIIIESRWYDIMKSTTLYIYEFDPSSFELQDAIAGYYISKTPQMPIAKFKINDCFKELINRNIEIKIVDNLFKISEEIKNTTFNWSLCRMKNAKLNMEVNL